MQASSFRTDQTSTYTFTPEVQVLGVVSKLCMSCLGLTGVPQGGAQGLEGAGGREGQVLELHRGLAGQIPHEQRAYQALLHHTPPPGSGMGGQISSHLTRGLQ